MTIDIRTKLLQNFEAMFLLVDELIEHIFWMKLI